MRVIDKLELATPKREDLSVYREILRKEFEEDTCFYCGKKLGKNIHVDHFIPWSFVKDDKLWNFVLSCARCNERKSNKLPKQDFLIKIEQRNKGIQVVDNIIVQKDFERYSQDLLNRMWKYAKMSGQKKLKCEHKLYLNKADFMENAYICRCRCMSGSGHCRSDCGKI